MNGFVGKKRHFVGKMKGFVGKINRVVGKENDGSYLLCGKVGKHRGFVGLRFLLRWV